jgi:DNA-directed RNA polymerase beta' subunit
MNNEKLRNLSNEEINNILNFIKSSSLLPHEISQNLCEEQTNKYKIQLSQKQIYPSKIPKLKEILFNDYNKSLITPGKAVGALASTSIGERNVQGTLSSFHLGGQSKVELTTGIPRTEEILNCTRDIRTPSCEIYYDWPIDKLKNLNLIYLHGKRTLEHHIVDDWLLDYDFVQNRELTDDEEKYYNLHKILVSSAYSECSWSIRLYFDTNILYLYRKTLTEIAEVINMNFIDLEAVPFPDNLGIIDIWVHTEDLPTIDEMFKSIKTKKKEYDEDEQFWIINDLNKEFYFVRDVVLPSIIWMPFQGIQNISKVFPEQHKNGQWFLRTSGSNLKQVIILPDVVSCPVPQWGNLCTTTNHLFDIYETFGIEATRVLLISEMIKLISVDKKHTELLIDAMSYTGKPQPANRYGIDRRQVGVFAKSAFETAFDQFLKASLNGEREDMTGISTCITAGIPPPVGTASVNLVDGNGQEINEKNLENERKHKIKQKEVIKSDVKIIKKVIEEPIKIKANPFAVKKKARYVPDAPIPSTLQMSTNTFVKEDEIY